jgi:hypothetical protein
MGPTGLPGAKASSIELHPKKHRSRRQHSLSRKWEKIAMKVSLLFVAGLAVAVFGVAVLGIAPANAEMKLATTGNCSTTTWPVMSPVQCSKLYAHSYVECAEMVRKMGVEPNGARWWCTNQGFKN